MFFDLDLRGDALPPKTLCLTYDDGPGQTEGDGPGPKTAELGQFLAERGVAATFFVIGRHVREHPGVVARLRAGGHLVGNHTDTHPTLVSFARDGGDVAAELARADEAIGSPSASGELTFFRAPYGYWRDDHDPDDPTAEATTSTVARVMNADGRFPHLVGPVGWDVDATDWDCWRSGASAEECGRRHLEAIERAGRGIILLHDSSDSPAIRAGNLTHEMTRWLVPILQERGYRFVRLDEVPGVASAARVTRQVLFVTEAGRCLTCFADSSRIGLTPEGARPGGRERFGVVPLGPEGEPGEVVALRAWNGRYLTRADSGAVLAGGVDPAASIRWTFPPAPSGRRLLVADRGEAIAPADAPATLALRADAPDAIGFALTPLVEVPPLGPGPGRKAD